MVHGLGSAGAASIGVCLAKELSRESERSYTKLSVSEKVRLQFDNVVSDSKKPARKATGLATRFK